MEQLLNAVVCENTQMLSTTVRIAYILLTELRQFDYEVSCIAEEDAFARSS